MVILPWREWAIFNIELSQGDLTPASSSADSFSHAIGPNARVINFYQIVLSQCKFRHNAIASLTWRCGLLHPIHLIPAAKELVYLEVVHDAHFWTAFVAGNGVGPPNNCDHYTEEDPKSTFLIEFWPLRCLFECTSAFACCELTAGSCC